MLFGFMSLDFECHMRVWSFQGLDLIEEDGYGNYTMLLVHIGYFCQTMAFTSLHRTGIILFTRDVRRFQGQNDDEVGVM